MINARWWWWRQRIEKKSWRASWQKWNSQQDLWTNDVKSFSTTYAATASEFTVHKSVNSSKSGGGGDTETQAQCEEKLLTLFRDKLWLNIKKDDIVAVHQLGRRHQKDSLRGIIVRLVSRRFWDLVILSCKKLRGTGIVIVEDLSPRRYARLCPGSGELRTQKLKTHLVRTQSLNVLPLKPGVGQHMDIHATLTARDFFLAYFYLSGPFTCIFSKTSPDFSCVGCG